MTDDRRHVMAKAHIAFGKVTILVSEWPIFKNLLRNRLAK
jgi:hypothetical protein